MPQIDNVNILAPASPAAQLNHFVFVADLM